MPKFVYFLFLFLCLATLARPAYAYLDPGTGAIILQVLLGGFAGALVIARLYWQRIKSFFGIKSPPEEPSNHGEAEKDEN